MPGGRGAAGASAGSSGGVNGVTSAHVECPGGEYAVETADLAGRGGKIDKDRGREREQRLDLKEEVTPGLRRLVDPPAFQVGRMPGQTADLDENRIRGPVQAVAGHLVAEVEAVAHDGGPAAARR